MRIATWGAALTMMTMAAAFAGEGAAPAKTLADAKVGDWARYETTRHLYKDRRTVAVTAKDNGQATLSIRTRTVVDGRQDVRTETVSVPLDRPYGLDGLLPAGMTLNRQGPAPEQAAEPSVRMKVGDGEVECQRRQLTLAGDGDAKAKARVTFNDAWAFPVVRAEVMVAPSATEPMVRMLIEQTAAGDAGHPDPKADEDLVLPPTPAGLPGWPRTLRPSGHGPALPSKPAGQPEVQVNPNPEAIPGIAGQVPPKAPQLIRDAGPAMIPVPSADPGEAGKK